MPSLAFWPLFLTRELTFERRIPASKAAVLALVQDPDHTLHSSPLIISVVKDTPDESQPEPDMAWYTVTERVPLGAGRGATITNRLLWGRVLDGVDGRVFASMGTRVKSEVRVREVESKNGEEGEVVVCSDKWEVRALFFFMPYILSTARKAHTAMLDTLAEQVLQKGN